MIRKVDIRGSSEGFVRGYENGDAGREWCGDDASKVASRVFQRGGEASDAYCVESVREREWEGEEASWY